MTSAEKAAPLELIDAGRLRRIAQGAGTTDQEVMQLLFSYREYCEQIYRAGGEQNRGSN